MQFMFSSAIYWLAWHVIDVVFTQELVGHTSCWKEKQQYKHCYPTPLKFWLCVHRVLKHTDKISKRAHISCMHQTKNELFFATYVCVWNMIFIYDIDYTPHVWCVRTSNHCPPGDELAGDDPGWPLAGWTSLWAANLDAKQNRSTTL